MNINAKYSLKEIVYVCWISKIIYAVSLDANNVVEYRLWDEKSNSYDWYDEWQIDEGKELVWFNENEDG